jgi:hypothetical protein
MSPESFSRPRRVLVTISGGGFFWQSRNVTIGLAPDFALHYATAESPETWNGMGLPDGTFHEICRITTMTDRSLLRQIFNFAASFVAAYRVVKQVDPDAIVCIASSIAVPLCFWGRMAGKTTVFVESITRVSSPSLTGRILTRLRLCDRVFVQWPEAVKLYKGAVYQGAVL